MFEQKKNGIYTHVTCTALNENYKKNMTLRHSQNEALDTHYQAKYI